MASLRVLGRWLDGSGWYRAMSKITSSGRADAMIAGKHVTRTRCAHEVTTAALYVLQRAAHGKYTRAHAGGVNVLPFDEWCAEKSQAHPQFLYCGKTLELELLLLQYVLAFRERHFQLYVECMGPWMFALNHYAWWLPVHIRYTVLLHDTHRDAYD